METKKAVSSFFCWAALVDQLVKNLPAVQETLIRFLGRKDLLEKGHSLTTSVFLGFPGGSLKNLSLMQETWVRSLVWEDPLEGGMATHSSILAWEIPMDSGAWRAKVHGVEKSWT